MGHRLKAGGRGPKTPLKPTDGLNGPPAAFEVLRTRFFSGQICATSPDKTELKYGPGICGRLPMPVYDYLCKDCNKAFEKVLTLAEYDKQEVKCPSCGGKNVVQELKAFFAVTSKKS